MKENLHKVGFRQSCTNSPHIEKPDGEFTDKKSANVACQPHQHAGAQPQKRLNNLE